MVQAPTPVDGSVTKAVVQAHRTLDAGTSIHPAGSRVRKPACLALNKQLRLLHMGLLKLGLAARTPVTPAMVCMHTESYSCAGC
jgi:hypothetical protein